MLLEMLQDGENLTETERELADFILDHLDTVVDMTVRQLANEAFVSPPMVSRLCRSLGTKGWNDFKVRLAKECTESYQLMMDVDSNFPFNQNDSPREIADKLAQLSIQHILSARDNLDVVMVNRAAEGLLHKRSIDVYGEGTSLAEASEFAEKMLLIGYPTYLIEGKWRQYYQAEISTKENFAIIISYSALLSTQLKLMKLLHRNHVPVMLITGNPRSPMTRFADYVCVIYSNEEPDMTQKIGRFGVPTAIHYILDVLYSYAFAKNYKKHVAMLNDLENDFYHIRD